MRFLGYGRTVRTIDDKENDSGDYHHQPQQPQPQQLYQPRHYWSNTNTNANNNNTNTNDTDVYQNCYFEYDHASGRHILKNNNNSTNANNNQIPKYSWKCILCNMVDVLIFAGCIAFLYFAIRYAFYCLENYGNDGGGN